MRELQQVLSSLPALLKALPVLVAYIILLKIALAHIRDWHGAVQGQDAAYTLAGLSAIIWALSR